MHFAELHLVHCISMHFAHLFRLTLTTSFSHFLFGSFHQAVSDDGAEGVYSALGNVPLFAVNLVAGTMSGFLLQNFVPNAKAVAAGATLRPGIMWGIIGATCLTSPLCLSMLRRYVEEPEVAGKVSIKQAVDEVEMEEQLCLHGSDVSSE